MSKYTKVGTEGHPDHGKSKLMAGGDDYSGWEYKLLQYTKGVGAGKGGFTVAWGYKERETPFHLSDTFLGWKTKPKSEDYNNGD